MFVKQTGSQEANTMPVFVFTVAYLHETNVSMHILGGWPVEIVELELSEES